MKILSVTLLPEEQLKRLRDAGVEIVVDGTLSDYAIKGCIEDFDALIVGDFTPIPSFVLEAGKKLAMIVHIGDGSGRVNMDSAREKHIPVCHTPGSSDRAISELIFGHIIACDRQIVRNTEHLRAGEWRRKCFQRSRGLAGRTLGLIGTENAAQRVSEIAKTFGMQVMLFCDQKDSIPDVLRVNTLQDIAKCDVVSIHSKSSDIFIAKEFFDAMPESGIFVNTCNSVCVDWSALKNAVLERDIRVGLDVYDNEPVGTISDFQQKELVALVTSATCHIGNATLEAREAASKQAVDIILHYIETGEIIHSLK